MINYYHYALFWGYVTSVVPDMPVPSGDEPSNY